MSNSSNGLTDNRWLAYELHDGLMQWVFGAKMLTESALNDLESSGTVVSKDKLRRAIQSLEAASKEGRSLIQFLEKNADYAPGQESGVGLAELLESLVQKLGEGHQSHEITIRHDGLPILGAHQRWNLIRIIEQAVVNALQHAGPCKILVALHYDAGQLTATVEDDGCGFDVGRVKDEHFGLRGLRHRTQILGGELELSSTIGEGSRICLTFSPNQPGAAGN